MAVKRRGERRGMRRRAEVVRSVVNQVVRHSGSTVTVQRLQDTLNIPPDAAARIVANLVNAGILREVQQGVWARVSAFPSSR